MLLTLEAIPTTAPLLDRTALEQAIREALDHAQIVTTAQGINATEAVIAWEVVEELLTEKAHRYDHIDRSLEKLCQEYPGRVECLIYDV